MMDKKRVNIAISTIFIMLMIVRSMEIIFVKTDQTWIGENIIHKICCILLIAIILSILGLGWKDIGFSLNGFFNGLKYGIILGVSTFFISYLAEFIVLYLMGKHPGLQFYVTNFSLSQTNVIGASFVAMMICLVGNIINVWAEEGLFRGLIQKMCSYSYSQKASNIIQSVLFGIWHITNVLLAVIDGSMSLGMAIFMGFGYVMLAGILAYEWGVCMALTGVIWIGIFEHLFNNFISNALHTVTETGTDEMMIIRITLSNILSLLFVLIAARKQKKITKKTSKISAFTRL